MTTKAEFANAVCAPAPGEINCQTCHWACRGIWEMKKVAAMPKPSIAAPSAPQSLRMPGGTMASNIHPGANRFQTLLISKPWKPRSMTH